VASNIRVIIHHSYIINIIIILYLYICIGSKITFQSLLYDRSISMGFFFFCSYHTHVPARAIKTKTRQTPEIGARPPTMRTRDIIIYRGIGMRSGRCGCTHTAVTLRDHYAHRETYMTPRTQKTECGYPGEGTNRVCGSTCLLVVLFLRAVSQKSEGVYT